MTSTLHTEPSPFPHTPEIWALDLAVATGHQDHLSQTPWKLGSPQAFCMMAPGTRGFENDFELVFLASLQFNWDLNTALSVMFNSTFTRRSYLQR